MATGSGDGAPRAKDGVRITSGRYTLVSEVGRSYLGALWLGRDPAEESRSVFVRRVTPLVAATARAALLDAARWSADTHGEEGVEVVENRAGVDFVTPFVDAEPLRALLRTAALRHVNTTPALVVRIVKDVLAALVTEHRTGSPHAFGGVHPDSIFVGLDGRVRLLDVGVGAAASAREPWRSDAQRIGYFAPEQVEPRSTPDARADTFAIGILCWEALSNRRLFPGNDAPTVKDRVLKSAIARLDATRPSGVAGLSSNVADVVARALERDLGARYASAEEMLEAVDALESADDTTVAAWVKSLAELAITKRRQLLERAGSTTPPMARRVAEATPKVPAEADVTGTVDVRALMPEPAPSTTVQTSPPPASGEIAPSATTAEVTPPAPAPLDLFDTPMDRAALAPEKSTEQPETDAVPPPATEEEPRLSPVEATHSEPAPTVEDSNLDPSAEPVGEPSATHSERLDVPLESVRDFEVANAPGVDPTSIPSTAKSRAPLPPSKRPSLLPRPAPRPSMAPKHRSREDAELGDSTAIPHSIHTSAFATLTAAPKKRGRSTLLVAVVLGALALGATGFGYWMGRAHPDSAKTEATSSPDLGEVRQPTTPTPVAATTTPTVATASAEPEVPATPSAANPPSAEAKPEPVPAASDQPSAPVAPAAVATATSEPPHDVSAAPKEHESRTATSPTTASPVTAAEHPAPSASAAPDALHRPPPSHSVPNSGYKPGGI